MTWLEDVKKDLLNNDGIFDCDVDMEYLEYWKIKLLAVIADNLEGLKK